MSAAESAQPKIQPLENAILVAVATKGENLINQHFGHADEFQIYAVNAETVYHEGTRHVEHYCQGGYGDEDKREVILRALADCKALFIARVGDGPKARLIDAGIEVVDGYPYGVIEQSIGEWFAKRG